MRLAPLALLLATGCALHQTYYTPPPGPPPGPLLSATQAIDLAAGHARAHGMTVQQVTEARLDDASRWHVGLAGPGSRAQVLLDGVSGQVLEARLDPGQPSAPPSSPPPPPPDQPAGPTPRAVPGQAGDWEE